MAKGPKPLRNWAAMDPLMRKGGVHQEARNTLRPRMATRQALNEYDDWQNDRQDDTHTTGEEGPHGPSSARQWPVTLSPSNGFLPA